MKGQRDPYGDVDVILTAKDDVNPEKRFPIITFSMKFHAFFIVERLWKKWPKKLDSRKMRQLGKPVTLTA